MSNGTSVVIIGGGPAGSAISCYLSKAGISNTIVESAVHPRPHVGESLVTSTTRQFKALGFLETMEREGFTKKYGASWHPPRGSAHLSIEFAEFPQEGVDQDYTYHVDRSRFDLLLLKHAEEAGAKVLQGVRVKEVLFEEGRAAGVKVDVSGELVDLKCQLVVDASGRATVLGRQLGLKIPDPTFDQYVVHGWFENVDRGENPEFIHIHFLPVERGWVWQIPISPTVTSMGVVAEKAVFRKANKDHAGWFYDLVRSAPDIDHAMREAQLVGEFTVEADYSYSMKSFVGDGFVLVGDAARFVDPIFSSGVSVALASAELAAAQIEKCFEAGDFSAGMLEPYELKLRRGTAVWYEFIELYYKLLPLFTRFIRSKRYRHQVLSLLQGEVFERDEVPVLDAMREYIQFVEQEGADHPLHASLEVQAPAE